MNEDLRELAKIRNLVELTKIAIEAQHDVVGLLPEQQKLVELMKKLDTHKEEVKAKESTYREECVKQYLKDGTKVFAGGKIKMFVVVSWDDDEAKAYVIEKKLANLLSLNSQNVKKYIVAVEPDEFGAVKKEPRLSLATDLSDFLAQEVDGAKLQYTFSRFDCSS